MGKSFEHKLKHSVRTKMAKHKTIKKHEVISGRAIKYIEDELAEHEEIRESETTVHDLVCQGMEILFPYTQDITDRLNKGATSSEAQEQLNNKCAERVKDMEIEDLEDLVYFMSLMDHETGAFYWDSAKPLLQEAVDDRLYVLAKEKEDDDE